MQNNKIIGIIGAMDSEIKLLTDKLEERVYQSYGDLTFVSGNFENKTAVIVKSGIGKVNAARCTQLLIDRYNPTAIINTGIAGGIYQGLSIGDFIIGTESVQHDFDVTAFGHYKGYMCTGDDDSQPTIYKSDEILVDTLSKAARSVIKSGSVLYGRIATGDTFVSDAQLKKEIHKLFNAAAAEMESGAIAQTACYANIPFVTARTISDLADGTAAESFEEFENKAANISAEIVLKFISLF